VRDRGTDREEKRLTGHGVITGSGFKEGKGNEEPSESANLGVSVLESSSLQESAECRVRENREANEKVESAEGVVRKRFLSKTTSLVI
jgi:hypothetical protein